MGSACGIAGSIGPRLVTRVVEDPRPPACFLGVSGDVDPIVYRERVILRAAVDLGGALLVADDLCAFVAATFRPRVPHPWATRAS